jgi:hypothetical protein
MAKDFPKVDPNNDPLTKYLQNETSPNRNENIPDDMDYNDSELLNYLSVDLNALPAGIFYKTGTKIMIRAAEVSEVQAYSTIVNDNLVDVTEKMNDMLSRCVRIKFANGSIGSYKDIRDNDRIYLIFMIRELTFQKNINLAKDVKCEECEHEFKIQYRATPTKEYPKTFVNFETKDEMKPFFDTNEKAFVFNVNGKIWKLAPPTISLQEDFFNYIKKEVEEKRKPNVAFMKIMPYTLVHLRKISEDGIKAKEKEFKDMKDMDEFQFLNEAIAKMEFGIKELQTVCPSCGLEVHSDFTFPEGAASIFTIPGIFAKFAKK